MERRALVAALALIVPLALYGVPYAYAASTQSTYVVHGEAVVPKTSIFSAAIVLHCSSPSDYTQHFFVKENNPARAYVVNTALLNRAGLEAATGDNPNGWAVTFSNAFSFDLGESLWIICQSPVTVAGVGVPEFGSLYMAIALGAAVYFILSRRLTKRPIMSAIVEA